MTDLIALAKSIGMSTDMNAPHLLRTDLQRLQAFAKLIRQDEREACAVLCDSMQDAHATIWDCAAAIRARTTT